MNYKDECSKLGYNQEELYFEKMNRELIQKLKTQKLSPAPQKEQTKGKVIPFSSRAKSTSSNSTKKAA